jgi:hypothetical protein
MPLILFLSSSERVGHRLPGARLAALQCGEACLTVQSPTISSLEAPRIGGEASETLRKSGFGKPEAYRIGERQAADERGPCHHNTNFTSTDSAHGLASRSRHLLHFTA